MLKEEKHDMFLKKMPRAGFEPARHAAAIAKFLALTITSRLFLRFTGLTKAKAVTFQGSR